MQTVGGFVAAVSAIDPSPPAEEGNQKDLLPRPDQKRANQWHDELPPISL